MERKKARQVLECAGPPALWECLTIGRTNSTGAAEICRDAAQCGDCGGVSTVVATLFATGLLPDTVFRSYSRPAISSVIAPTADSSSRWNSRVPGSPRY